MAGITIANVRDWAQIALGDPTGAIWSDATVEAWVIEAIRDYSIHFKRLKTKTIDCVDDQHNYELPYDVREIITVEFPVGEDPPAYLDLLTRKDPRFWSGAPFYDFEPAYQETLDTSTYYPELWISAAPDDTQDIEVTYHAHFYHATQCLVPDEHIPLLILFVQYRAVAERLAKEIQAPDYSMVIVTELRGAVEAHRATYERAVKAAAASASRGRWAQSWEMDSRDRIY
jgi:hypothetical protein